MLSPKDIQFNLYTITGCEGCRIMRNNVSTVRFNNEHNVLIPMHETPILDGDDFNKEVAKRLGITDFPTLKIVNSKTGDCYATVVGSTTVRNITRKLEEVLLLN